MVSHLVGRIAIVVANPMYIAIFLEPFLTIRGLSNGCPDGLAADEEALEFVAGQLFFDWLCTEGGDVQGIEPHVTVDDLGEVFFRKLKAMPYVTWEATFPRIWFSERRDGGPIGAEDWDDAYYATDERTKWAIVAGTGSLSEAQVSKLSRLCHE
jgi:hypothetical protein